MRIWRSHGSLRLPGSFRDLRYTGSATFPPVPRNLAVTSVSTFHQIRDSERIRTESRPLSFPAKSELQAAREFSLGAIARYMCHLAIRTAIQPMHLDSCPGKDRRGHFLGFPDRLRPEPCIVINGHIDRNRCFQRFARLHSGVSDRRQQSQRNPNPQPLNEHGLSSAVRPTVAEEFGHLNAVPMKRV
jgi:hypothetical protein